MDKEYYDSLAKARMEMVHFQEGIISCKDMRCLI